MKQGYEMNTEIGSYEAKTKLPELLRSVQSGQRFTITLRGAPIAELIPFGGPGESGTVSAAVSEMKAFPKIKAVPSDDITQWIREGRK